MIQTTWAGYSFDQNSFDENPDQYAAYFLAADQFWTGAPVDCNSLDYDYRAEFARFWSSAYLPQDEAAGWTVDLSKAANLELSGGDAKGWLGHVDGRDMAGLPVGVKRLGRFLFNLPGEAGKPKAVVLAGKLNPEGEWPSQVVIDADGKKAGALAFAVAATVQAAPKPPMAKTVVTYADGTTAGFDWKLQQNVFSVDDDRASAVAPVIWKAGGGNGEMARAVHCFVWQNPSPEKAIKSIALVGGGQASGLMLFGVSGISAGK